MAEIQNSNWGRDDRGRFGRGNPGGPGGPGRRYALRRALEAAISPEHIEAVGRRITRMALEGNLTAIRLLLERTLGRPAEAAPEPERVGLMLPELNTLDGCGNAAEQVMAAINEGRVDESRGEVLLACVQLRMQALQTRIRHEQDPRGATEELPVSTKLVRAGFLRFKRTGELPENVREAVAVVRKVKAGFDLVEDPAQGFAIGASFHDGFVPRKRAADEAMDALLDEAVHGNHLVRAAARQMLRGLVTAGFDVTAAQLTMFEVPAFGSVGMMLMGFPERLARAPYREQALRLFARVEAIQAASPTYPQTYCARIEEVHAAATCFQLLGERPSDPAVLDALLVVGELMALLDHFCGENVRDVMRLYDVAASGSDEDRERAIAELQAMARAGRFAS